MMRERLWTNTIPKGKQADLPILLMGWSHAGRGLISQHQMLDDLLGADGPSGKLWMNHSVHDGHGKARVLHQHKTRCR
jgi:hypothetical protein